MPPNWGAVLGGWGLAGANELHHKGRAKKSLQKTCQGKVFAAACSRKRCWGGFFGKICFRKLRGSLLCRRDSHHLCCDTEDQPRGHTKDQRGTGTVWTPETPHPKSQNPMGMGCGTGHRAWQRPPGISQRLGSSQGR